LASQWVKDTFGDKYKSSRDSCHDEIKFVEIISIEIYTEDQDLVVTYEKVMGEMILATHEYAKYTTGFDML
jgi:hypothetical protein